MSRFTTSKIVAEFIDQHPEIQSKAELTQKLYEAHSDIFNSYQHANTMVRKVTGAQGSKSFKPDSPYYRYFPGGEKARAIEYKKPYAHNTLTNDYIFFTHKLTGKFRVLKDHQVKSILDRYSNFDNDPNTINEIALKFGMRREEVMFILRALGITHDSLPFTDEMIADGEPEKLVDDLFIQKRNQLYEKYTTRQWNEIQEQAQKWQEFEAGTLNPIREFIEGFEYRHKPIKPCKIKKCERAYILTLSDLHFGAYADPKELFYGSGGWNMDKALDTVKRYVEAFGRELQYINAPPCKLYLVLAGDLAHSLTGYTTRGTRLENTHPLGVDQILYCYHGIDYMIQHLLSLTVNDKPVITSIEVIDTEGNHDVIADWAIVQFLIKAYANDKRVRFLSKRTRWVAFQVFDSLFVVEHGSSPYYKSKVPRAGSVRKAYVQDVLMQASKEYPNAKYKYFLTADQHNLEHSESNHFEFIRLSTIMHDRYADHMNLYSRPRQTVLEVRSEGVKADIHFYFD